MRVLTVLVMLCSLLLLPFSGNSSMLPAHQIMMAQSDAAVVVSMEQSDSELDHCAEMAAAASAHTNMSTQATTATDCCDESMDCSAECSASCGHCAASGHGSSAAADTLHVLHSMTKHERAFAFISLYSFTIVQVSPPPIIS